MLPDVFPNASFNCLILRITGSVVFYPAMQVLLLRVFLLFYWVILTKAGAEYYQDELAHTSGGTLQAKKSFIGTTFQKVTRYLLRNRSRLTDTFWTKFALGMGFFFTLLTLVNIAFLPGVWKVGISDPLCIKYKTNNNIIGIIDAAFFCIVPIITIAIFLRKEGDNFFLKEEVHNLRLLFIVYVLCQGVSSIFQKQLDSVHLVLFVSTFAPVMVCPYVQLYKVIWWSYKYDNLNNKETNSIGTSQDSNTSAVRSHKRRPKEILRDLLTDNEGHQLLLNFLMKEFAAESLYFYDSLRRFRSLCLEDSPDMHKIKASALEIFNEFIHENASLTINISSACRERLTVVFESDTLHVDLDVTKVTTVPQDASTSGDNIILSITEKFENPNPAKDRIHQGIFDEAQSEIIQLLASDSLRRLQATTEYQEWKNKFENDESR
jgi:hypothetical protein